MLVPDYQSLMLPVLQAVCDGKVHSVSGVQQAVAQSESLTDADLEELLPSGKQATFVNRSTWAMTYMKQTGLLSRPKRGHYEITEWGREALRSGAQASLRGSDRVASGRGSSAAPANLRAARTAQA